MFRKLNYLLCSWLAIGLTGLAQGQTPTIPESPVTLEAYDLPGYFLTATTSTGAVRMIQGGSESAAAQWNLLPGLANAAGISFESVLLPNNIMRHRSFVLYTDPRATDSLFQNDATLLPRPGLADPTAVSFESNNYRGYYLMRNASFGLGIVNAPTDLGAATFRFPATHKERAKNPAPADKATDVPRDAGLSWTPGQYAATHNVYFGTAFDDVNNASQGSPAGVLASQGQTAATYDPAGLLTFGQTYYWRIDEVNAAPDSSVFKGDVWSFTAETYGYRLQPVKATASSSNNALTGPEKTIDGSGLDALDQHDISISHMWLSKKGQSPIWIKYDFDKVYSLYQMWVWNSNQAIELDTGFGAKDVLVETSLDGTTWTALGGVPEFAQATADANYVHNTTVDFGGAQAKYVRLTINSNWGATSKQAGLSEVRFSYVPVQAYGATPANGASAAIDSLLNWRPGRTAAKHEVYLGTDANAVIQGTALVKTVTDHSLDLGTLNLEYGRTFYWKVNEVNDAATPKSWEGDLWSFTTPDYGVVDDFESYDNNCRRIFFAWVDGLGYSASQDCGVAASSGNGTGSTVGNASSPFAERTIVHGGSQSMPLAYSNSGTGVSEATRTFSVAQDWTQGGAKTLVLYFRGAATNNAAQLYVKINATRVDYPGGTAALAMPLPLWKQWNIDLTALGASTLKAVTTLTVGVSGNGMGTVYVDDIRLYRVTPPVPVPTDPGNNGLMLNYRMEGDVKDSSGKGYNGTAEGSPAYADGPTGYGQALQFDAVDDDVTLPIGPLISTLTSCSFTAWANSVGGQWSRVFDFGNSSTAGYMMLTARDPSSAARFAITATTSTGESFVASPVALSAGWHHLAGVIDGPSKRMQLFVDGELVASGPTNTLPSALGKTTQNWLGKSQWPDPLYSGRIDEFRIYSRPLTPGEIRYLAGDR
jgi:hypothetical protein